MTSTEPKNSGLPPHIEGTILAIAQLHAEHHQDASRIDRAIDRATASLGSPAFLGLIGLIVTLWIGANLILPSVGGVPFDPPPFPWLVSGVALMSLNMGILILTTQRRADRLASRREQMTLELALLSEHRTAKIIALIEELRFDSPNVRNRVDEVANAMASPADAHAVLDAIQDTRDDLTAANTTEITKLTPPQP